MKIDLLTLAGLWTLWCGAHSLLAADGVREELGRRLKIPASRYRLFYNLVALLTLIPVLVWSFGLPGADLLAWRGPWRLLQWSLWLAAGWLGWAGLQVYPLDEFLGLDRRPASGTAPRVPALKTDGVLGLVRHPWYLAGLLVLWSRDLNAPALVTSLLLSAYLVVGAFVEEGRLEKRFGRSYADYRSRVPMWLPWRRALEKIKPIFTADTREKRPGRRN